MNSSEKVVFLEEQFSHPQCIDFWWFSSWDWESLLCALQVCVSHLDTIEQSRFWILSCTDYKFNIWIQFHFFPSEFYPRVLFYSLTNFRSCPFNLLQISFYFHCNTGTNLFGSLVKLLLNKSDSAYITGYYLNIHCYK